MTNEEKENILDQHKTIYDGYVTSYAQQPKEQPLYTQDFANDKQGITVNNKGVVTAYKNMGINEMKYDGKSTGLFSEEEPKEQGHISGGSIYEPEESFESEMEEEYFVSLGEQLDMIGDGPMDLDHGVFGDDDMDDFDREDNEYEDRLPHRFDDELEDESFVFDDDSEIFNDVDEDETEGLFDSLRESLDMFKRFTKYN
jgi:hypothetical protein